MSTFENDLRDSLARRADSDVLGAGVDLGDVKGRARRIQRRRRGAVVAAVAIVAAVAVPGSLALSSAFDRTSEVPPVTPVTPSPAPTPDHALAGDGSLDFRDLPVGPDPAIGYLDLTGTSPVVIEAGGNETVLELEHVPMRYTDLEDGRYAVLTRDDEGNWYVEVTDTGGTTTGVHPTPGGFVVDEAHRQVAWGSDEGEVLVLAAGVEEPRVLGEVPGSAPMTVAEIVGTDCFAPSEPGGEGAGCLVHVNTVNPQGEPGPTYLLTRDEVIPTEGTTEDFLRHADSFSAGDPQETTWTTYTAGIRRITDGFVPCSEVYGKGPDPVETSVLIETCEHVFDSFSPDGGLLLAWGTEEGAAHTTLAVYDMETRELLWERRATTALMGRVAFAEWEDAEHLLAPVLQGGRWQLVRFSADGAVERVTGQVLARGADETDTPFIPEAQHSTP